MPSFTGQTRIIDWLRLVLAVYVCAHHASYILWQNPVFAGHVLQPGWAPAPPDDWATWFVAGASLFWEEAVHLFFVISGFCVHFRLAQSDGGAAAAGFSTADYLQQRLWRIVPPCWAAIGLTVVADAVGQAWFPALYGAPTFQGTTGTGWFHLVGNLLFLQQDSGPVFLYGSNLPLWSLHCEMMYYLAYPVFIALIARTRQRLPVWIALFALSVVVLLVFRGTVLPRALREAHFWIGGALVAELFVSRGWRAGWWAVGTGLVLMLHESLIRWLAPDSAEWARVATVGGKIGTLFGCELLLLGLLGVSQSGSRLAAWLHRHPLPHNPGYSLYLIHFPLLMLASAAWLRWIGPLPGSLWPAAAATALVVGLSWGFYFAAEAPPLRWRSQIRRRSAAPARQA